MGRNVHDREARHVMPLFTVIWNLPIPPRVNPMNLNMCTFYNIILLWYCRESYVLTHSLNSTHVLLFF